MRKAEDFSRLIKKPKPLYWTSHSRYKMNFYRLSESRVKRIIHSPNRIEEGIAPKTIAMMQSVKSAKNPYELWTMIQETPKFRKIISAWRYPGVTKPRSEAAFDFFQREMSDFSSFDEGIQLE